MAAERPVETFHTMVLGVNHETSSVELRDRLLFTPDATMAFSRTLTEEEGIQEVVILSTCNRAEIYTMSRHPDESRKRIEKAWSEVSGTSVEDIRQHGYCYVHEDAVRHLYRVACSLDSLVIGESQVVGQVKDAFSLAQENATVGYFFNHIFREAIRVSKRVSTETAINEGAVSMSYACVELARKVLGKMDGKTVGIIGSGEMGELTAEHMKKAGVREFVFFNRSPGAAKKLSERFGGRVCALEEMNRDLASCDIVVSSTGSQDIVVSHDQVRLAMKERQNQSMFLIDIAAPRDIDPLVADIPNAFLFTIDDLKHVVRENVARREDAAREAMLRVDECVRETEGWFRSLEVLPMLRRVREKYVDVVEEEIRQLPGGMDEAEREKVEAALRNVMNRFLHEPLTNLKMMGENGEGRRAVYYAGRMFGVDSESGETLDDESV